MGTIYLYDWRSRYAPSHLYEGIICGIEKSIISIFIGIWREAQPGPKKRRYVLFFLKKRLVSSPSDQKGKFILRVPDNNLYLHSRVRLLFDCYLRYEHSFCPDFGL